VKSIGQINLVQDFRHGGVDRIAAKLSIEVLMHFEQRHRDSAPRKQQREHRAGWSGPTMQTEVVCADADMPLARILRQEHSCLYKVLIND
jgi:hypothetical protein